MPRTITGLISGSTRTRDPRTVQLLVIDGQLCNGGGEPLTETDTIVDLLGVACPVYRDGEVEVIVALSDLQREGVRTIGSPH